MTPGRVVTAEVSSSLPILLIDREGSISIGLYERLKDHMQVVLVGGKEPLGGKNLLFLSYKKELPAIPHDPYSHIFFIPESEKELEILLPVFIKKAEQDQSRIFLILTRQIYSEKLLTVSESSKIVITVIIGDAFGNPLEFHTYDRVEQLVKNAKGRNAISLPEMGLRELHPVAFEDVVREVLRIAFALPVSKKTFFIGIKEPITELAISHALQKINPLLKIDFHTASSEKKENMPSNAAHILAENYSVLDKIGDYYKNYVIDENENIVEDKKGREEQLFSPVSSKKKKYQFDAKKFLSLFAIFLSICILLPIILFTITSVGSYLFLQSAVTAFENGNIPLVKMDAVYAKNLISLSQKTEIMLNLEMGFLNQQDLAAKFAEKTQMGDQIASALVLGSDTIQTFENMAKGKIKLSNDLVTQAINNGKASIVLIEKAAGEVDLGKNGNNAMKKITAIAPFFNVLDSVPNLIGMQGEKTYLILFQNNTELRPGGGFIGSYGILTLNQGSIKQFSIHDVYDADGQLKGHIEPPFAIRRYIPLVHLYLRDSNFDVDFTKNAYMAALLFQQETGQQVDGVIGADLSFVKGLLAGIGSVYLPDYSETVDSSNMFLLTENHAEKNFFPGSSQKKDFLRSLFTAIQNKMNEGNHIGISLIGSLVQSIQEKHMLFAFSDAATQELFTANYLSSALWDPRVQKDNTVNDFLGVNEANIGVNKVNYWINREVSQSVSIADDGSMQAKATLTLSNMSKGDWPGGDYKSYVRFILPGGAILNKITIDGQEQVKVPAVTDPVVYEAKGFLPPTGLEVEKTDESGKTLYGFLILTPPLHSRTITVEYSYPQSIDTTKPVFDYQSAFFKQPGTENYPFSFSLSYPKSYRVLKSPSFIRDDGGSINYAGIVSKDTFFSVSFTKK